MDGALILVVEAADGADALRQFERHTPDLVVLDVMLPEVDGLHVLRAIRVRKLLQRHASHGVAQAGPSERERFDFGELSIDVAAREVHVAGQLATLTPKEFEVLAVMAASPRRVFSRAQLLEQVWDSSPDYQDPATVTVHVGRLRQKLEPDPDHPRWITTVWGVGYRFEP